MLAPTTSEEHQLLQGTPQSQLSHSDVGILEQHRCVDFALLASKAPSLCLTGKTVQSGQALVRGWFYVTVL